MGEAKMCASEENRQTVGEAQPRFLTDIVCNFKDLRLRADLDLYRLAYKRQTGVDVDVARRYTSTLPPAHQEWLLKTCPRQYLEGLPLFLQAFLDDRQQEMMERGTRLDDQPAELIPLLAAKQKLNARGRAA